MVDEKFEQEIGNLEDEEDIANRLTALVDEKMYAMEENDRIWDRMDEYEKGVLEGGYYAGLKEGIAAGLATLVALRGGRHVLAQRRLFRQSRSGVNNGRGTNDTYRLSDPSMLNDRVHQNSGAKGQGWLAKGFWIVFDGALSITMAAFISEEYFVQHEVARAELVSTLPLMAGRSVLAESMCDDMERELNSIRQDHAPAYERLVQRMENLKSEANGTNTDVFFSADSQKMMESDGWEDYRNEMAKHLAFCAKFTENCQRRRFAERQMRQEKGFDRSVAVSLESPVPGDAPLLALEDDAEGDSDDGSTSWATGFVTDREERRDP